MELIRPVGDAKVGRRRIAGTAILGFVLAVACVAMLVMGSKPKAISLSPADAVAAASAARKEVNNYMASMSSPEDVAEDAASPAPLDWNWRPEIQRDTHVKDWVGSGFVAPARGLKPMNPLTWDQHLQHPWHAAAMEAKGKDGDSGVTDSEGKADAAKEAASAPARMKRLMPLRYFPHDGLVDYDTSEIMQQAQESVRKASIDPIKVQKRSLGYVEPKADSSVDGTPVEGKAVAAAVTSATDEAKTNNKANNKAKNSQLEARLEGLKKQLEEVEAQVARSTTSP